MNIPAELIEQWMRDYQLGVQRKALGTFFADNAANYALERAAKAVEAKEREFLDGDGSTRTIARAEGCCDAAAAIRALKESA